MSHIVVYQANDGSSGFEPCTSLDAAIVAAERMRNVDGVEMPRIFRMEEVQFDFRPYFRVEVSGESPADFGSLSAGAMASLASAPSVTEETPDLADLPTAMTDAPEWPEFADTHTAFDSDTAVGEQVDEPFADATTESSADTPFAEPAADHSAPLEHSVSAMGSLGSVDSLNKLQESVEAFATNVDFTSDELPPPPIETVESASIETTPADPAPTDEDVMEAEEPEPANDPLVSVRRGLFGR